MTRFYNIAASVILAGITTCSAIATETANHTNRTSLQSRLRELRDTPPTEIGNNQQMANPLPGNAMRPAGVQLAAFEEEPLKLRQEPVVRQDDNLPQKSPTSHILPTENLSDSIPLRSSDSSTQFKQQSPAPVLNSGSLITVASSLAIVLGLFLCVVWISRRGWNQRQHMLSTEVVEILGRAPLTAKQHLQLIKFADKLLLVAVTADGAETLTEVTDPDEVVRVRGLCSQSQPGSSTASFREVLSSLNTDSP